MNSNIFDYTKAFSRNRGWLRDKEQEQMSRIKIAIAGCGGVGGLHALTLARLGVQRFAIADPDTFEVANFNRQFGATISTEGKSKEQVIKSLILDINPNAEVEVYGKIDASNTASFLQNVDIFVDGFDFFELETRRFVFKSARENGIPILTAAPIGMGASLMCFLPNEMSFEDYFNFGNDSHDNLVKFLVGMSPTFMHQHLLVDQTVVDFKNHKVPSTVIGCEVATSLMGAGVVKIVREMVNGKREIEGAPLCTHHDAFLQKTKQTRRGPYNVLRLITLQVVQNKLAAKK